MQKKKKNVCKRWIKNVADICHESNYLCTLSHMYVVKFPNLYDFSALQQVSKIFCSIGYVTNQNQ